MCSILVCRTANPIDSNALSNANSKQKMRGPDYTGKKTLIDRYGAHLLFVHNLLDISGQSYQQPVYISNDAKDTIILLFNGELFDFDHKFFNSDTEYLVSLIKSRNQLQPEANLGEYIIILYKQSLNQLYVLTDTFLTKPLYFGFKHNNNDFAIATYASCLQELNFDKIEMASPNSFYRFSFNKYDISCESFNDIKKFCLKQHKNHYDDWEDAFLSAVEKRGSHGKQRFFVPLSSGYDSGAICLALNLLKIKYETFSIEANESQSVLRLRIQKNITESCLKAHTFKGLSNRVLKLMKHDICLYVEPFRYLHEDAPGVHTDISEDWGALGLNYIAQSVARKGIKVALSGVGADEIFSDYGNKGEKIYSHSEFGGIFPANLKPFFPWKKFYGDTQRSYLLKEEFVLGRHGIEGRYPFLDIDVVQEFLSLSSDLKNKEYKAPIAHFLNKHNYPFDKSVKKGFYPHSPTLMESILKNLRLRLYVLKKYFE